jgi:hypothetical protein
VALLSTCFTLISSLASSSTLNMEETFSSKTSVDFQQTTQSYIPKGRNLHNYEYCCENLKSYNIYLVFSVFTFSPNSLPASIRAFVFFFMVFIVR